MTEPDYIGAKVQQLRDSHSDEPVDLLVFPAGFRDDLIDDLESTSWVTVHGENGWKSALITVPERHVDDVITEFDIVSIDVDDYAIEEIAATDEDEDDGERDPHEGEIDVEKVIIADGVAHLTKWTRFSADATTVTAWCDDTFDADANQCYLIPPWLVDRDELCLECHYRERKAIMEAYRGTPGFDT